MESMTYSRQASAYKTVHTATVSGREVEAGALMRCAYNLNDCIENWDQPELRDRLSEALKLNQKVWTIFQCEVSDAECRLPDDIRMNILKLVAFIDKQTMDILMNPAKDKLNILVNINLNIAAGLQGR